MLCHRVQHDLALVAVQLADGRDVAVEEAILDHLIHHHLRQLRGVQIGRLLGQFQSAQQRQRCHHVAEADTRRQHLGERAHVNHAIRVHRHHLRRRSAAIAERAVRIVLDQRQAEAGTGFDQFDPAGDRQAAAGRVLEIR